MGNWPQTALWDTDPDMSPVTESYGAHTACSRGRGEGPANRREGPQRRDSGRRLAATDGVDLALARQLYGSQDVWRQRKEVRKPI